MGKFNRKTKGPERRNGGVPDVFRNQAASDRAQGGDAGQDHLNSGC